MEMKLFRITFKWSESTYCTNLCKAVSEEAASAHYASKYEVIAIREATEADEAEATRKGMPIVTVEAPAADAEPEATPEADLEADQAKVDTIQSIIEAKKPRGAWSKGVKAYALDFCENLREAVDWNGWMAGSVAGLKALLLNGAGDWKQYSWGGSALIYDTDIATRLCNASELKKTDGGRKRPNAQEDWLDVQARALFQAFLMIADAAKAAGIVKA